MKAKRFHPILILVISSCMLASLLLPRALPVFAAATIVIDNAGFHQSPLGNNNPIVDLAATGSDTNRLGDQSNVEYWHAQSFLTYEGFASKIVIRHAANVGSPTGAITWAIATDNSGSPGSTLATGTYTATASADNTINITDTNQPYLLEAGTYWIVLSVAAQFTDARYQIGGCAACYGLGEAKESSNGGGSWSSTGKDLDIAVTVNSNTVVAQTFNPGSSESGIMTQFTIFFGNSTGTPSGTVTWNVYQDSGEGSPGTNLGTGTFTPSAFANNTVSVGSIPVSEGVTYHITMESTSAQSAGNAWNLFHNSANVYASGVAQYYAGDWNNPGWDFRMTVTTVTATDTPTPTGTSTETPTETPSSTPTDTPTPTATPLDLVWAGTLPGSGDSFTITRRAPFGELVIGALLLVLISTGALQILMRISDARTH